MITWETPDKGVGTRRASAAGLGAFWPCARVIGAPRLQGDHLGHTPESTLVAVYGTLRRGQHNHAVLGASCFVGLAKTAPRYTLFDLGVGFPGMVEGGESSVVVELYEVDAATLARLDRLEGVDHGLYRRVSIELADGLQVSGYLLGGGWRGEKRAIGSGDWLTALSI